MKLISKIALVALAAFSISACVEDEIATSTTTTTTTTPAAPNGAVYYNDGSRQVTTTTEVTRTNVSSNSVPRHRRHRHPVNQGATTVTQTSVSPDDGAETVTTTPAAPR